MIPKPIFFQTYCKQYNFNCCLPSRIDELLASELEKFLAPWFIYDNSEVSRMPTREEEAKASTCRVTYQREDLDSY